MISRKPGRYSAQDEGCTCGRRMSDGDRTLFNVGSNLDYLVGDIYQEIGG